MRRSRRRLLVMTSENTVSASPAELTIEAAGPVCECLHELFEAQVDCNPDSLALICDDVQWTYAELEQRANRLARHLREIGIGPGALIGLFLRRSEKSVLAILATLKAGAAYVPIDPDMPVERVRHIVAQSEMSVVLTDRDMSERAADLCGVMNVLVDDESALVEESDDRLLRDETQVAPDDLAYVLFTSGSTGRPKGVMTEHRNVVQFVDAFNDVVQITPADRIYHGFALSFDGSVEEMWMAFSNGACLFVGTAEIAHLGNDVARVFTENDVTVFSTVPTSLGMIHDDAPTLRLIIVSGEPCRPELVKKWARGQRRMLNVYGPTETTVNTTVAECRPDLPITIGRPLRGYTTLVLSPEMDPVPLGEAGELYIGGVGVARGYLSEPELTAKQFVSFPGDRPGESCTLYRTGDLVRINDEGEIDFIGRIDRQVKIRGFRIELSEIESVLREQPDVDQAVVDVVQNNGTKELAAFVVPHSKNGAFDQDAVVDWLRDRLPTHMLPSYLERLEALPVLPSGKVDRKRLPEPRSRLVSKKRSIVEPANEVEANIARIWKRVFHDIPISMTDDFFVDLGGYSLMAVEMAGLLRTEHGRDYEVTIRDVYAHPTIRELAEHLTARARSNRAAPQEEEPPPPAPSAAEVFRTVPRLMRWTCVAMQAVSIALIYGLASIPVVLATLLTLALVRSGLSITAYTLSLAGLIFVAPHVGILFSIAVKWFVIGRFKPGRYPVWGFYYFRWWLVTRMQFLAWTEIYVGTPMMNVYFRLMGARIGKHCVLDTTYFGAYDLVSIGEDTCVGHETQLHGYRVEDGYLVLGPIDIGSRCFIGTQCNLGLNVKMADDSHLDDLSLLPDGAVTSPGESWRGSPAELADVSLPAIPDRAKRRSPLESGVMLFLASEVIGEFVLLTAVLPITLIATYAFLKGGLVWAMAAFVLAVPFCVVFFCIAVAGLKVVLLPQSRPGVYSVDSIAYLRRWSVDLLMRISSSILYTIYTTIYLPIWLRMLGARLGRRAEIALVTQIIPDLVEIGEESFLADGSIIGGRRLFRGHFEVARNRIGRRSFLGNSAILPTGSSVGDDCLIGVLSTPSESAGTCTPDGTEWLGSPPFGLPHRQKVQGFAESTTYRPTIRLYLIRYVIDALRVLLPFYLGEVALLAFVVYVVLASHYLPLWALFALCPLVVTGVVIAACLYVAAFKQATMGTYKPVVKPLWCPYVWWNELIMGLYESLITSIGGPLLGTPFMPWLLRRMGCKVGKWTFIETELFSEFDLVEIGNYAALNAGAVAQNHLFEDRIMKSSHLRIGNECSVGNMSVVLYDTELADGAYVGPLSLVMKGESLPERSRWLGIPTARMN
jgi:non-ribosomal peptide synthetase-like protein